jgi:transcriptional antiterminator RfaH
LLGEKELLVFDPEIRVGDAVQITDGAFQGLEAVVTRLMPSKDRVRVLLDFVGRQIEAEVDAAKVLSVTPARQAKLAR